MDRATGAWLTHRATSEHPVVVRNLSISPAALAVFLLLFAACYSGPNVAPDAQIEFRAAERTPFEGAIERHWPGQEPIYLEPQASIVTTDIHRLDPTYGDSGQPVLALKLTPEGGAKMELLSRRHTGKPIAFLITDEIISAPVITGPMRDRCVIDAGWTAEELNELVSRIRLQP